MGRLFWKILLAVWGALLLGVLLFGSLAWFYRPPMPPPLAGGPGAQLMLSTAASTLKQGGESALQAFAAELNTHDKHLRLQAVDTAGHDLFGQPVDAQAWEQAQAALHTPSERNTTGYHWREAAIQASSPSGQSYVLFLSHGGHRPPFGPPDESTKPEDNDRPPHGLGGPGGPGHGPRFPVSLLIALGVLGSLAFSAALAWYLAQPIRHIKQALQALAQGRLETRVQPLIGKRSDELADLGHEFDRMSQQLQTLMQTQQRLLHDVSHELRSPLARLQAAAGLARQNPERMGMLLDRVETETLRLDQLVGEILTLARLENATLSFPTQEVDVHDLLANIADDAQLEAGQQNKVVRFESQAEPLLKGSIELLHRACENVVRNAIRHTRLGSEIDIQLSVQAQEVIIEILDDGPGVATNELEQMFEPFYRCEYSPKKNSFGLGLAIARRAIQAHGGSISANNRASGGLAVRITLPLHSPGSQIPCVFT